MNIPQVCEEINIMRKQLEEEYGKPDSGTKNYLFDSMETELKQEMEEIRLGKKEIGKI